MPLVLRLHSTVKVPLEVDGILPSRLQSLSAGEVAACRVWQGRDQVPLGEICDVSGSLAADNTLVWEGDCSRLVGIGRDLESGQVLVNGPAGAQLGARMKGGSIECRGSSGDWAGAEMRGGRLLIRGNAGHHVGAAYPGSRRGMRGGEIHVLGSAGDEVGSTLRRGLIAIGGAAGTDVGAHLIAGTIVVCGQLGSRPGREMRRGTVVALGSMPAVLPTFVDAGHSRPVFLQLLLRHLRRAGLPVADSLLQAQVQTWRGDTLTGGLGEIIAVAG